MFRSLIGWIRYADNRVQEESAEAEEIEVEGAGVNRAEIKEHS